MCCVLVFEVSQRIDFFLLLLLSVVSVACQCCLGVCGMVHHFFGCLCGGPSICLGDGIMLCVWDACYIGCWCIAGVCVLCVCKRGCFVWYCDPYMYVRDVCQCCDVYVRVICVLCQIFVLGR